MLSRFISRPSSHLRFLTLILSSSNPSLSPSLSSSSNLPFYIPNPKSLFQFPKTFSSDRNNGDDSRKDPSIPPSWNFSPENENGDDVDSIFRAEGGDLSGIVDEDSIRSDSVSTAGSDNESWDPKEKDEDVFADIDRNFGSKESGGGEEWETVERYKPWDFGDEGKDEVLDVGGVEEISSVEREKDLEMESIEEDDRRLAEEEEGLSAKLKGIDFREEHVFFCSFFPMLTSYQNRSNVGN